MYAMQYRIGLPTDYDMSIIRHRVDTKGHLLDDLPGLGLKAYLITEAGVAGAVTNQYAPFYLWTDVGRMAEFLWGGGGFQGIVASFGRPSVAHWTGAAFRRGPAATASPRTATLQRTTLAPHEDPRGCLADAVEALEQEAAAGGVHSAALAVDPVRWETVTLTLWEDEPCAKGERFTVLHLSTPNLADLGGTAR